MQLYVIRYSLYYTQTPEDGMGRDSVVGRDLQRSMDLLHSCAQTMDNIVKHSWPRTGPWGTELVTIPQPGIAPFTTAL